MTSHRLGGADHRLATGGAGSSPAGSIWPKTNIRAKLRFMLKSRDRQLHDWDQFHGGIFDLPWWFTGQQDVLKLDNERKLIREKLKSLGRK